MASTPSASGGVGRSGNACDPSGVGRGSGTGSASRSPPRVRPTGVASPASAQNGASSLYGSSSASTLAAAFGLRSNTNTRAQSYSRSPPPPGRASVSPGPQGANRRSKVMQAAHAAHYAYAASVASRSEGRQSPFPRSPSVRSLSRRRQRPDEGPTASSEAAARPEEGSKPVESDQAAALALECAQLRAAASEERKCREAAEKEAADLKRRLKLANDEVRIWRGKCELLEADLSEQRLHVESRRDHCNLTDDGGESGDDCDEPLYDDEISAIENALDKIYTERESLTSDLDRVRRRMLTAIEAGGVDPAAGPRSNGVPPGAPAGYR